jgi:glycosyltransferase involved in cell wall biosynthesis
MKMNSTGASIDLPKVSVVIPTNGLRDWGPAVASAANQADVTVEILLVNNGDAPIAPSVKFPELRILSSPPSLGANGARQLGIENSRYELIALLDDDDVWFPSKLREQILFMQALWDGFTDMGWVCGAGELISEIGRPDLRSPREFSPSISDAATYLFRRKSLRAPLNQLQSSTLLFPKSVALAVPFRADLKLHQDWTWLLDVEDVLQAPILICPKYLVRYHKGTGAGITRSTKAAQSMEWGSARLSTRSKRIRGDFALTVPFNMALEIGAVDNASSILLRALRVSRPGPAAVTRAVLALIRAVLRQTANRTLSNLRGLRK